MKMKNYGIPLAVTLSLLISGCTAEPAITEEQILKSYFSVFDSSEMVGEPDATVYIAPDSPAETYADELLSRLERGEADGLFSREELVLSFNYSEPAANGAEPLLEDVSLCFDSSDHPDSARENFCFVHKDFEFSEGQLVGLQSKGDAIHGQIVLQYFGSHALSRPEERLAASDFSAPGSNAEKFAVQQSHHAQAVLDGGDFDAKASEILYEKGVIYSCSGNYRDTDAQREEVCRDYSEFSFESDRLANFKAGEGLLDGRVIIGDGELIPIGAIGTLEILSAYDSSAGTLWITAEVVSNTETLKIPHASSVYLGSNGRQIASWATAGPYELKEGRVANVSYLFSGAFIGGELELEFWDKYPKEPVSIRIG